MGVDKKIGGVMELQALSRKERIIITAIEVIDELGIQGLSVREVAKRQNMSSATMFNHFKTKSDLIIAVLEHYSQYDSAIIKVIGNQKILGVKAILYTVEAFISFYESYPPITSIMHSYDVLRREPDLMDKVIEIYTQRDLYMKQLIEEAQQLGELRGDFNSNYFTDVILGTCRSICLKWRIGGYKFSLKEQTVYAITMILDSFKQLEKVNNNAEQ